MHADVMSGLPMKGSGNSGCILAEGQGVKITSSTAPLIVLAFIMMRSNPECKWHPWMIT
jgi:hypothetical protein